MDRVFEKLDWTAHKQTQTEDWILYFVLPRLDLLVCRTDGAKAVRACLYRQMFLGTAV